MKKTEKFLNEIAIQIKSTTAGIDSMIWVTKADGSYITHVGMEDDVKFLMKRNLTKIQSAYEGECKPISLAFNEEEQKWYGWSHRAIFGFGIDSECKIGDCGFLPANKEEFEESCLKFWGDTDMDGDTHKTNPVVREETRDGKPGSYVEYTYDNKVPNKKMRGQISGVFSEYPEKWGKGQWTAQTLEEAKLMAIDFANGVS